MSVDTSDFKEGDVVRIRKECKHPGMLCTFAELSSQERFRGCIGIVKGLRTGHLALIIRVLFEVDPKDTYEFWAYDIESYNDIVEEVYSIPIEEYYRESVDI